jgi:hypothetical protein
MLYDVSMASYSTSYPAANSTVCITGGITLSSNSTWQHGGYLTSTGTSTATLSVSGKRPVIRIEEGDIDLKLLLTMMQKIQAILCIIEEDIKQHEKYPALKELYDQFKIVEAMVKAEDD